MKEQTVYYQTWVNSQFRSSCYLFTSYRALPLSELVRAFTQSFKIISGCLTAVYSYLFANKCTATTTKINGYVHLTYQGQGAVQLVALKQWHWQLVEFTLMSTFSINSHPAIITVIIAIIWLGVGILKSQVNGPTTVHFQCESSHKWNLFCCLLQVTWQIH